MACNRGRESTYGQKKNWGGGQKPDIRGKEGKGKRGARKQLGPEAEVLGHGGGKQGVKTGRQNPAKHEKEAISGNGPTQDKISNGAIKKGRPQGNRTCSKFGKDYPEEKEDEGGGNDRRKKAAKEFPEEPSRKRQIRKVRSGSGEIDGTFIRGERIENESRLAEKKKKNKSINNHRGENGKPLGAGKKPGGKRKVGGR